jgi:hypothetical protein
LNAKTSDAGFAHVLPIMVPPSKSATRPAQEVGGDQRIRRAVRTVLVEPGKNANESVTAYRPPVAASVAELWAEYRQAKALRE